MSTRGRWRAVALAMIVIGAGMAAPERVRGEDRRTRTFDLTYEAVVSGLDPGHTVRLWLPVPPSDADQTVELTSVQAAVEPAYHVEPRYGNRIAYFEGTADEAGRFRAALTYRVHRREAADRPDTGDDDPARFLQADRLVPVGGPTRTLLAGLPLPDERVARARQLYDRTRHHMEYRKDGTGWGRGDVAWACDNAYGNCTDYHSLFISMARTSGLPARFEIGFPLPPKRGAGEIAGYHCWARFHVPGRGWVPVDISEADKQPSMADYYFGRLTEDRVTFSLGRDIDLVPRQAGEPLNFFIYPHAEVAGRALPEEQVTWRATYRDHAP